MKSKLLSAIAMPAALALGSASVMAQETTPPPANPPAATTTPEATSPAPAPTPSPSAAAPSAERSAGTFAASQSADEWRSSNLVGMAVYNENDEKIGDINDLILGSDGQISNAVIGVGGFLGMGEKLVAVSFSDLKMNRDSDGNLRVTMNSTKEALQNAPDYKYHNESRN